MLAEIHGKISRSLSNLHDRSEDQLTGDFFGSIRYLPFEVGLQKVLMRAKCYSGNNEQQIAGYHDTLFSISKYNYHMNFWQRLPDHGEIDILLSSTTADCLIGIEVKYESKLSSDDDIAYASSQSENDDTSIESINQLKRYSGAILRHYAATHKHLVLLAPVGSGSLIADDVKRRNLVASGVSFWLLTWQDVLDALNSIEIFHMPEWGKLVISDLIQLLSIKGFDCFRGFNQDETVVNRKLAYLYKSGNERIVWPTLNVVARKAKYEYS